MINFYKKLGEGDNTPFGLDEKKIFSFLSDFLSKCVFHKCDRKPKILIQNIETRTIDSCEMFQKKVIIIEYCEEESVDSHGKI